MALILGIVVHYFPSRADLRESVAKNYPVDAVEYLNHHAVPGPMYNTYGFGGYLILSRAPENKVFMDGRGELYEDGPVLADYLEISDVKPGVFRVLSKYGFQSFLTRRDEPLATVLHSLPEWESIYEDHTSVLFVRRSAARVADTSISSQVLVAQHGL
jgi:hypothetical protein